MYQRREDATLDQIPDTLQAWVEKRRWNAFMRAEGFSCPSKTEFEAYFKATRNYKNFPLKFHPCLVERDKKETLCMPESRDFLEKNREKYDCLDYVSIQVCHAQHGELYGDELQKEEFKQWDTVRCDSALQSFFPSDEKQ